MIMCYFGSSLRPTEKTVPSQPERSQANCKDLAFGIITRLRLNRRGAHNPSEKRPTLKE